MMFTSVIVVNESFLEQPKISGNGKMFKVIDGALHAGEYERLVGAIGMIIGEKEFRGQLLMEIYLSLQHLVHQVCYCLLYPVYFG